MVTLLESPYIEADSVDIIELMRSIEPVKLAGKEMSFTAQGYIVLIKQENRQIMYAALHVREIQRSLVFDLGGATIQMSQTKGEEFLNGIGFRLEPVSLKYSPAMREVILREIPVILPVETAQRICRDREKTLAEWQQLVSQPEPEEPAGNAQELSLAEWTQHKQSQEALAARKKAATEHLAKEEQNIHKFTMVRELIDPLLQQVNAEELATAERSDRERLHLLLAEVQKNTKTLEDRILQLEEELKTEKTRTHQLARGKKMTDVLLAESRQQLAQAESARDREIEERKVSELARKDAEKRLSCLHEKAMKMKDLLTMGSAQKMQLAQDKELAEKIVLQLRQEVVQAVERLQAEVARHQKSRGEMLGKLAAAEDELRQARVLIAHGEAERARLAQQPLATTENRQVAERNVSLPHISDAEVAAFRKLQIDVQQFAEKERLLCLENDRLLAEKVRLEKRLTESETNALRSTPVPHADKPAENNAVKIDAEPPPHVLRRPPAADAVFRVDWDLAGVPYHKPEDFCEIEQTMNRVRLSLEGYPDQYCSACLIVLKDADKKKIFIPFRLSSDNRVLVYVPVNPPETPAAFDKKWKEAKKFLQVVGLDLESVPLSNDLQDRAKSLETFSVLIHPSREAGNF